MKPVALLQSSRAISHVSGHALQSLENALIDQGFPSLRPATVNRTAARALKFVYKSGALRSFGAKKQQAVIVPMMGLQEGLLFPWVYRSEVIPIVFDCMPFQFDEWVQLFRRCRIEKAFFTASMVVSHFRQALPHGSWEWLPEAINVQHYNASPSWEQRSIDVLEFGRRYARYHLAIKDELKASDLRHIYEKVRGELVFATHEDFVSGLSQTKVSVCFPQSQTHPERFGDIETLTQRYLESMASGTIILGSAPAELVRLFGYDPVIAVDWARPVQQLTEIIQRPALHAALRERNLRNAQARGAWRTRVHELISALQRMGYANTSPGLDGESLVGGADDAF